MRILRQLIPILSLLGQVRAELSVAAHAAYLSPDPERGARRGGDGVLSDWESGTRVTWYGYVAGRGDLHLALRCVRPFDEKVELVMKVAGRGSDAGSWTLRGRPAGDGFSFGRIVIPAAGYYGFTLEGQGELPDVEALRLDGPAAEGARFSSVERRNAASVHLRYPLSGEVEDEIEWFHLELTPQTDPLWSYYMATGWHRGYFGMQVNGPGERRIIFSVWDAGDEGIDRSKVDPRRRVVLLAKGEGVEASGFGNEGTGGHSHLVYPWKLGDSLQFLTRAEVAGEVTTYTGWFRDSRSEDWRLIASFRAPEDGRYLRGLYSFNENFSGANGDLRRVCEFGNAWVRTKSGRWMPLLSAGFSHDGHGDLQRLDRSAGVKGGRFYLANGGFVDDWASSAVMKAGATLRIPEAVGMVPPVLPAP